MVNRERERRPESHPPLAVCSGYSDRRIANLTGLKPFKPAAIAAGEPVRTLVVSAG
jgi:hypothetical protein